MKIKKRLPKKKGSTNETEELKVILHDLQSKSSGMFEKYRMPVIIAAAAVVILIAVIGSYKLLSARWDRSASVIEYRAYNLYLEGNYSKAISSFQEIADKYSGSKSAPLAWYYIGNSYSALGQPDDAIRAYRSVIDKYSGEETLLPLVYLNLGSVYAEKKDYENAVSAFRNIMSLRDSFAADRALYEMARVYEASGDKAAAIEQYETLTRSHPASSWGQEAKARLGKLKGDSPVLTGEEAKDGGKQGSGAGKAADVSNRK